MSEAFEIPLRKGPQKFSVQLGANEYQVSLAYAAAPDGGWHMTIADADGKTLVAGVMVTSGEDILQQFAYLGIPGAIYAATDNDADTPPTFANLGTGGQLFYVSP